LLSLAGGFSDYGFPHRVEHHGAMLCRERRARELHALQRGILDNHRGRTLDRNFPTYSSSRTVGTARTCRFTPGRPSWPPLITVHVHKGFMVSNVGGTCLVLTNTAPTSWWARSRRAGLTWFPWRSSSWTSSRLLHNTRHHILRHHGIPLGPS
jgi:hypothetical protein